MRSHIIRNDPFAPEKMVKDLGKTVDGLKHDIEELKKEKKSIRETAMFLGAGWLFTSIIWVTWVILRAR